MNFRKVGLHYSPSARGLGGGSDKISKFVLIYLV